ncbi:MAG: hypothetical protein P4K93_07370 [Terracidiphilus sp.]|nr:hypothetical protein [Terracidiphilus sp.]
MTTLAAIAIVGLQAAMPPSGVGVGIAGRTYHATDTGQIFYDNGTAWVNVTPNLSSAAISSLQQQAYSFGYDDGAANAYVVTLNPAPVLIVGSTVSFKAEAANTGPSILVVTGSAAIPIVKKGSVALAAGDIAAGQIIRVIYDGVNFQI